jgi:transposase
MSNERRVYTAEFKREAIRLAETSGKSIKALERELGLGDSVLRVWIRKAKADGADAFPGHGRLKPADEERRRLERELEIVRQERDILKKALAIFTQEPRRSSPS